MTAFFQQDPSSGPLSCVEAEEWMMLRLYGELSPEQSAVLDRHLAGCDNCRREMASLRALEEALALGPSPEASETLLVQTRMRLRAALDAESEKASRRWFPLILGHVHALRAAPFAAAAMLLVGVGAGSLGGYQYALKSQRKAAPVVVVKATPAESPIASVSSVAAGPNHEVTVGFNRLVPESATGSTDDPFIRRVLAMGVQSPTDPGVQDNAVNLLSDACLHGPQCDDSNVRNALMTAARYDGNPALRSKALNGLEPYVAEDTHVRDAIIDTVMNDGSPEVREQAVRMLSPVEADTSVRQLLHNVSTSDSDPQVRSASETMSREAFAIGMRIQ